MVVTSAMIDVLPSFLVETGEYLWVYSYGIYHDQPCSRSDSISRRLEINSWWCQLRIDEVRGLR